MYVRTVLILFAAVSLCDADDRPLYLLDLYDCVDDYEDYCHDIPEFTVRAAIELANNHTDILPGYTLHTPHADNFPVGSIRSGEELVSVATIGNFNIDLLYARAQDGFISPIVMGSPFSFVNEYAAYILGNETMLNLSQVTYGSLSTSLDRFPYFYHVGPNENILNSVRHQLMQNNNWKRVGLLSSAGIHSKAAECLEKQLEADNIEVSYTASFILGTRSNGDLWQLDELRKEDIRIIIGFFSVLDVPTIMCESYHVGLVDEDHVWILPEMNLKDIWKVARDNNDTSCSVEVLQKMSMNNALMVGAYYENSTDQNIDVDVHQLDQLLLQYYNDANPNMSTPELSNIPGYHLSRVIFDVTWAVILALNYSNSEGKLDKFLERNETSVPVVNHTFAGLLSKSLNQVRFYGLSGLVDLNKENRTSFKARISQIINGSVCPVEIYAVLSSSSSCNVTRNVTPMRANICDYVWGNDPPLSGGLIKYQGVPAALLYFTIVATALFLSFALVLLVSNIALKKRKYVKTANPVINALIIFAAMLIFISNIPRLVAFGAIQYNVSRSLFAVLCEADLILSEFGIVLTYTLILLKTWRLYQITTNKLLRRKIRFISNQAIFTMLPLLVSPVVMLLLVQCFVDTAKWYYEQVEYKGGHPYKWVRYTVCYSYSRAWKILASIYNLLLIFCIFWQAGHVSQMKFRNLALEGEVSLQALALLIIVPVCGSMVQVLIGFGSEDHLAIVIVQTVWYMLFPIVIVSTIFLPKYYIMCKGQKPVKKNRNEISFHRSPSPTKWRDPSSHAKRLPQ